MGPTRTRRLLLVAAVSALVLGLGAVSVVTRSASAAATCNALYEGDTVTLTWPDEGGQPVIRRGNTWIDSLPRGTTSHIIQNSPLDAQYSIRSWQNGTYVDLPCNNIEEIEAPAGASCTVEPDGAMTRLSWSHDDGQIIVRRDNRWLATLVRGSTSYTDVNAVDGARYTVRAWFEDTYFYDMPCSRAGDPVDPPTEQPDGEIERVIHISIDGLRSDHVTRELMPNLSRLRREGASTLNARSDPANTRTLPNHLSQVTGRPVTGPNGHGVAYNEDENRTVHAEAGRYVASVFDVVHDRGGATVALAGKSKFDVMNRSWNRDGRADQVGANNGRAKIDVFDRMGPRSAVNRLFGVLNNRDDVEYAFLHVRWPDVAGHEFGFGNQGYEFAVARSDRLLGDVLDRIAADADLADTTAVLVVTDHGGPDGEFFHGDPTERNTYTIPFVVWGPGVEAGADLYELNPERREPGTGRPLLDGRQPIRGHDAANLALDLLGYPAVPGSAFNADQSLDVN